MSISENFGLLHSLNFMYLTLSHQGDGELHPKEFEKSSEFVFKYALESESIRAHGLKGIEDYARTAIEESCKVYDDFLNRGRDKIFEFYGIIVGLSLIHI